MFLRSVLFSRFFLTLERKKGVDHYLASFVLFFFKSLKIVDFGLVFLSELFTFGLCVVLFACRVFFFFVSEFSRF